MPNVPTLQLRMPLAGLILMCLVNGCASFAPPSRIYVNQHGYEPRGEKVVVCESSSPTPITFKLEDASGVVVHSGTTTVKGSDKDSGEDLHWIRLPDSLPAGDGYRVVVGDEQSPPFSVSEAPYRSLKYDALAYFYYNRSGTSVAMPWAKDFKWTRPAGHLSDEKVSCIAHTCPYSLDVRGGWYDAGDYGKYVVNGGIALWTLFNLYERTSQFGDKSADFGDGKLSVPEGGNAVPDILDEARWEMEFILRMQVPPGEKLAGMVHHKIHDRAWSVLGRTPPERADNRDLYPPSTAATLNLVATAAQCTRLFEKYVPDLANRCRTAMIRGWNAAGEHPAIFASPLSKEGGGPYDDDHVSDEFYWAAAELYTTLGDPRILAFLRSSPHFLRLPEQAEHEHVIHGSAMTWQATAALGTLTLAMGHSKLPAAEVATARSAIVEAASSYLTTIAHQGFRVPMGVGGNRHYPWGSSSFVLNNAIILGLAADFTRDAKYRQGVVESMDYLLGRNPLGFSYISGYGTRSFSNPHHRFWAHQKGRRCPTPPPGAIAGGPNSKLPDPISKRLAGCPVQKCYVDHLDAWGVNEVAINWNAPLAWVAAYLDDSRPSSLH